MQNTLIIAIMYSDKELYNKVKTILIEKFNKITKESNEYDFDQFTHYYEKEMGKNLLKKFLIFKYNLEKKDLIKIKKQTTEIERLFSRKGKTNLEEMRGNEHFDKEFSINGNRTINLDPGYVNENELVLASFKKGTNYKEDLGEGVYAHKVLEFKDKLLDSKNPKGLEKSKTFQNKAEIFWHTFPDYRVKENQEFFLK